MIILKTTQDIHTHTKGLCRGEKLFF